MPVPSTTPPPAALDPKQGWVAGSALESLQRRLAALEAEVEMHQHLATLDGLVALLRHDVNDLMADVAKLKAHTTYSTPD